jgi:hypothetical protein
MLVQDTSANYNTSVLLVNIIDGTPPVVSQPSNVTYEHGQTGNILTWVATDNYPATYSIYREGSFINGGNWNSGENINISVDGLSPGVYEFVIFVQDTSFWMNSTSVYVIVTPDVTKPNISTIPNFSIFENDTDILLGWLATDFNPTTYELFVNGSSLVNGTWQYNVQINYTIVDYSPGIYNYSITVYDIAGLNITSSVFVTIKTYLGFFVDHPQDFSFIEGFETSSIIWTISGNRTGTFTIYQEAVNISSGTWVDNHIVNHSLTGLSPGLYNYTIVLNSSTYEIITDTVFITVNIDTINPLLSDETDQILLEHSVNNSINWTFFDDNPDYYELLVNDFIVNTDIWPVNNSFLVSIDNLGPGFYNYTFIVYDTRGNFANDSVLIFVIDNTAPVISIYPAGPNITIEYNQNLSLTWQAHDYSPSNYTVYLDSIEMITDVWINNSLLNITLDLLKLGDHNISIIFRDMFGQSTTHEILIIVKDSISPVLSSPTDMTFTEGSSSSEIIIWSVTDDFNGTYMLYKNGALINSGTWNGSDSISVDVSNLTQGTYNFTLSVIDFSGNTNSDMVSVDVLGDTTTNPPSSSSESSSSSSESSTSVSIVPSTTRSSTLSTTSIQISSGFEYIFVLLMLFVNLSIIRFRRKKNQ